MEERLGRRIQELNEEAGTRFTLSFSLGYAIFDPDKPVSYDELFIEADQRMYAEKRANKRLRRRADDPGFP
jgi:GGDEF domain-containing protein